MQTSTIESKNNTTTVMFYDRQAFKSVFKLAFAHLNDVQQIRESVAKNCVNVKFF